MFRTLLPALVLLAPGLTAVAPGQTAPPSKPKPAAPKTPPAPPSKPKPPAPEGTKFVAAGPVTVGSPPPADPAAPAPAEAAPPVVFTKHGLTLLVSLGVDGEKTMLVAHVPVGVAQDFQRRYVAQHGWAGGRSPAFALTGRLTTEDAEPLLFPSGQAPIFTEVPAFRLGDKKRLVLVADAVQEITRFNRDRVPGEGYAAVEGPPADAKADLKLADAEAETLAVRNGPVPVLVPNRKPPPGGVVRATGTLLTHDGVVRLQDATVKVVKK